MNYKLKIMMIDKLTSFSTTPHPSSSEEGHKAQTSEREKTRWRSSVLFKVDSRLNYFAL